ncbi:MAG TPA: rhamnogalacturonan acetylesterase [Chitinophagaceae bacterium]|nr:rhamnogalacturonan acetylesterase [Chitinophagaceae bacterium]
MKYLLLKTCLLMATLAMLPPKKKMTLWLIGDSTMSVKQVMAYPETGWGMPFVYFWDSTVVVQNLAQNGRSTSSFMKENRWQPAVDKMEAGDYVFIQFGHNDEVPTKATYTTEEAFAANLLQYIKDSKNKAAIPVLLTPVARRKFNAEGKVEGTHDVYSAIVRRVAKENNVVLIDLDQLSQQLLQQWGEAGSVHLYNHLRAGEHPHYPEGKEDNTHFNELGARIMAELVLSSIRAQLPALAERIITPPQKK